MANYFNYFPKTYYLNYKEDKNTALETVTNIIARFTFEPTIKENSNLFYPYDIQDGDTPEIIASKYYGSSERHWIVLLFNDILDPQYDWPLSQRSLYSYINDKYSANGAAKNPQQSGMEWAQDDTNVHSYYKVVTRTSSELIDGTIKEKFQVDADTYLQIIESVTPTSYTVGGKTFRETVTKEKLSYYNYEVERNESKRRIKLLRKEFVTERGLLEEFKRVLRQ